MNDDAGNYEREMTAWNCICYEEIADEQNSVAKLQV
jgi:hypothetical protein